MTTNTERGALEALLFVSDEPVSPAELARMLERTEAEVADQLVALAAEYAEDERGFQLREVAGGWRLYTHPAYHDLIEGYVLSWDTRRLSQAALEALAVIAYHQPVTRAGVGAVRGVNSEAVIASLIEKGLVREMGRDKMQGNAILYGTTRSFLEKFGLRDLSGLPSLADFAPDEEAEAAIRLRLGAGVSAADALGTDEDDELLYGTGDEEYVPATEQETAASAPQTVAAIIEEVTVEKVTIEDLDLGASSDLVDGLDRDDEFDLVDELEDVEELD
ncbi:MAG: SMC-Scp complex subunit ScpB [Actinomycetia bacterium]|nr:SMC-Scp complex subunit ScpB [Actinomycetes bacterium]